MRDILVLIKGELAQNFLKRLCGSYDDTLLVVAPKEAWCEGEHALFYDFDPSSALKMRALCEGKDLLQAFIFLDNEEESLECYKILRELKPNLRIVMVGEESVIDPLCEQISIGKTLGTRLLGYVPYSPRHAQFIGLGKGEIMEVKVGSGSSFAYRHISSISQKRFKIALVYREDKPLLAKPGLIIKPNDSLLLVGEPLVLKTVYFEIKAMQGRFPSPYGENILVQVDMGIQSEEEVRRLIDCAILTHTKLNSKILHIYVLNAKLDEHYQRLRSLNVSSIRVKFDFLRPNAQVDEKLIRSLNIGLLIVANSQFEKLKSKLFALKLPVLKTGDASFASLSLGLMMSSSSDEVEELSSTCFDVNKQFGLDLELYYYAPDESNAYKFEHFEHIKSLAKLHSESIKINDLKDINPLAFLNEQKNMLHFLPFDKRILGSNFKKFLSTDFNKLYYKMKEKYQLFIPGDL